MKRAAIGVGAGLVIAVAAALAPWRLSGPQVRARLIRQVEETAGLRSDLPTKVTFSLLPRPRVKLENVSFESPQGGLSVSASSMKADLDLFDLALGRIELSSVTLYRATIDLDVDHWPIGVPKAVLAAAKSPQDAAKAHARRATPLAWVRLVDAVVFVRSPRRRFATTIRHFDVNLDWRTASAPASLVASGVWRGRAGSVSVWLGDPRAFLRGGSSPLTASASSDLLSAKFDGVALGGADWRLDVKAETSSPALRPLSEWILDGPSSVPSAFSDVSLSGRLTANSNGFDISDLSFTGGGSDFDGEAALRLSEKRPLLAATLASNTLALTPFLDSFPPLLDGSGAWNGRAFAQDFGPIDIDLRLSAAHAKMARLEMGDLGLAVLLHGNRLDVSLPEGKLYGGGFQGQANVVRTAGDEKLTASGAFSKVETSELLWDADSSDVLDGSASGTLSVSAHGDCVAALVRSLQGDASFDVRSGEVVGMDFEQALRRIEKRPLSVAAEVHGGRTAFDRFSGKFLFSNDMATLKNVEISGPGAQISLTGSTLLADRALDVTAMARQAGSDGAPSPGGSTLTVKVEGFWDDPRLVLDAESLMRRSEAAAPLFGQSSSALQAQ